MAFTGFVANSDSAVHFQTMICGLRSNRSQWRSDQEISTSTMTYTKNWEGLFFLNHLKCSMGTLYEMFYFNNCHYSM